ncbi:MAG: phosphohistidine phosphatase SixA [Syntrophales bacterium]|nr:phosphohistidine phosphatase SixA [Syntrophales bacterium]MDD5640499.1 phosphohistidine phosphatase SixA [Syntrophales bacterium]
MFLYLVQHAEAHSKEEDPARDLSEKGREDIEEVAHHLKRLNIQVRQIFHSGKTRAASTAKVLANHLQPPVGISEAPGLAPLDDPEIWADRLAHMDEDILLVGHLPHLGKLAALLLSGDQEKQVINFQMGGALRLRRMQGDQWAVDWMIPPEIIL